jgi:hypothetical protein
MLSDEGADLGQYGLGDERTLHDYELYAGLDFVRKRAHPDVFTGRPPSPVTLQTDADRSRCVTIEDFFRENPERTAMKCL